MLVDDEVASSVASCIPTINQQTVKQTEVMQEVVSSEVIKLNQTLSNKQKTRRSNTVFSRKKDCRKRKMDSYLSTHRTGRWIVLWNNSLINSTRIFFHLPKNTFYAIEKKQMSELG